MQTALRGPMEYSRHFATDQPVCQPCALHLQDERRSLQSQLSELQGESAVLEATRHRAAQLEAAIGALQQRAKELLAQLEDERCALGTAGC